MATKTEYVELHCHSHYSLLDGASSPESLVERAAELGYPALALTDHDGLYGAVRFWRAARQRGIQPIIGAEVTLDAAASSVPAFYGKKVKAWLRGPGKLKPLPAAAYRRLAEALGVDQSKNA